MTLLYPKIYGPFNRATEGPRRNKLIKGQWSSDEFEALQDVWWIWTEKIDGTNIRIIWDGYNRTIGGRTDNANINADLINYLTASFPEELLEQVFKHNPATLFGEGFGAGIQKGGGNYSPEKKFALFDVAVDDPEHPVGHWWLKHEAVEDIARKLGIARVPFVGTFSVNDAILAVEDGLKSAYGDFVAEGIVGKPLGGLLRRDGRPVMMKVKTVDFQE